MPTLEELLSYEYVPVYNPGHILQIIHRGVRSNKHITINEMLVKKHIEESERRLVRVISKSSKREEKRIRKLRFSEHKRK